ncbi:MAG: response regulator [Alphaproteobacteria bacterium]|nr:response regulator [Alphaproteobacteria bacterium]
MDSNLDLSGIPVLIVDDDQTTRIFLDRILRRIGFDWIDQAEDGGSALEHVAATVPAVVFCDLHMTPVDGLTFLAKLRFSETPGLKNLPVVMLTSDMRDQAIEMAKTLKATDYLVKPATRIEVKAAAGKALGIEIP